MPCARMPLSNKSRPTPQSNYSAPIETIYRSPVPGLPGPSVSSWTPTFFTCHADLCMRVCVSGTCKLPLSHRTIAHVPICNEPLLLHTQSVRAFQWGARIVGGPCSCAYEADRQFMCENGHKLIAVQVLQHRNSYFYLCGLNPGALAFMAWPTCND